MGRKRSHANYAVKNIIRILIALTAILPLLLLMVVDVFADTPTPTPAPSNTPTIQPTPTQTKYPCPVATFDGSKQVSLDYGLYCGHCVPTATMEPWFDNPIVIPTIPAYETATPGNTATATPGATVTPGGPTATPAGGTGSGGTVELYWGDSWTYQSGQDGDYHGFTISYDEDTYLVGLKIERAAGANDGGSVYFRVQDPVIQPVAERKYYPPTVEGALFITRSDYLPEPNSDVYLDEMGIRAAVGEPDNTSQILQGFDIPSTTWEYKDTYHSAPYRYNVTITPLLFGIDPNAQPTPTPTPTATVPAGICAEYDYQEYDPIADWGGFTIVESGVCNDVIPPIDIHIAAVEIITGQPFDLDFPGLQLCYSAVEFGEVALFGLSFSMELLALPFAAMLIGLIIKL